MQITQNISHVNTENFAATQAATVVKRTIKSIAATARRMNSRRKLKLMLDLSPHLLDDIGLSRSDVADALTAGHSQDPVELLNARRATRCAELIATMDRTKA